MILADEVNRATPKAQSALLEAMEEQQVSVDGVTHPLPSPFFVIATQNPVHQVGTFPLPESQLDRFLMRIGLGYPAEPLERKLLRGDDRRDLLASLRPVMGLPELNELQAVTRAVQVTDAVLDYVQALVRFTRESPQFELGLSPRAAVDLVAAARCWALINGHTGVYPEDVQAVFAAVAGHRLRRRGEAALSGERPGARCSGRGRHSLTCGALTTRPDHAARSLHDALSLASSFAIRSANGRAAGRAAATARIRPHSRWPVSASTSCRLPRGSFTA